MTFSQFNGHITFSYYLGSWIKISLMAFATGSVVGLILGSYQGALIGTYLVHLGDSWQLSEISLEIEENSLNTNIVEVML